MQRLYPRQWLAVGNTPPVISHHHIKPMTEEQKSRQIELLKQKYNWDKIAEETLKVYQEIK